MESVLGAIVIAGKVVESGDKADGLSENWDSWPCLAAVPLLGCSTIVRTVEFLRRSGLSEVSVFSGQSRVGSRRKPFASEYSEEEAWLSAASQLQRFREDGLEAVLIIRTGAYVECELSPLFGYHRQHGEAITRGFDTSGGLDLWVVDPKRFDGTEQLNARNLRDAISAECEVGGYVNRLQGPQDLRRMATDIMSAKCKMRPHGVEVRPGVWMDEGAQLGRGTRVVAPAYIGRDVKVAEDCLITRSSNVESNSQVDFGTAVEDTSILSNTYIGIGLDLCHSVVDGDQILNLHHEVLLRISDPVVLRRNSDRVHKQHARLESEANELAL